MVSLLFNDSVRLLIERTRRAELSATGSDRRVAFGVTRVIFGGLVECGYPIGVIADAIGVCEDSVRARVHRGGFLRLSDVVSLTGLSRDEVSGALEPSSADPLSGEPRYAAIAVVAWLTRRAPDLLS